MLKIIRQYVNDSNMAQDILHDGFLIILSHIQSLRQPERLEYWMGTIMKNLSIHSSSKIQFTDIDDTLEKEMEIDTEYPFSYDDLLSIINQLPNGYRTVFRLSVLEGKSHKEIADMLGITPHTSASQLTRAKEKLRQLIQEHMRSVGMLSLLLLLTTAMCVFYIRSRRNVASSDSTLPLESNTPQPTEDETTETIAMEDAIVTPPSSLENEASGTDTILVAEYLGSITNIDTLSDVSEEEYPKQEQTEIENRVPTPSATQSNWALALSTNSLGISTRNMSSTNLDFVTDGEQGEGGTTKPNVNTSVHHLMPITLGLHITKEISRSWSMECGMQYSLLRTNTTIVTGGQPIRQNIRAHFLSIPIDIRYCFVQWNKTKAYTYGGCGIDIPIGASIKNAVKERSSLHYPFGVTLNAGLGIEYKISSNTYLYIQPSLNYHIMKDSTYPILWQDKPFTLELPIGIRLSW
jgi:RNA polymerase sigma factor (sigma-70 family)